jgi:DNA polymerase type B, organellar and viral
VQPHEIVNFGASTSSGRGRGREVQPVGAAANTIANEPRHYRVLAELETFYPRFQMNGRRIQIRFNNPRNNRDMVRWIDMCLEELVSNIKDNMYDLDKVGLEFTNQRCPDRPFYVSPRFACYLDKDVILARMYKVLQSNIHFFSNDVLSIAVTHIKAPYGGRRDIENMPFEDYLKEHHSAIININRQDRKCFAYAILAAKVFYDCLGNRKRLAKFRRGLRNGDYEWLDWEYENFWEPLGLGIDVANGATLDHVKATQEALKDYFRIHIFLDRNGRELAFTPMGDTDANIKDIYILLEENHYVFIKPDSLATVFGYIYYCIHCKKGYAVKGSHYKCAFTCPGCFEPKHCTGPEEYCDLCNRSFNGIECKNKHLQNRVCKNIKRCTNCGVTKNKHGVHKCGLRYCNKCRTHRPSPHLCMIAKKEPKKTKNDNVLYVYYDFESRMDEQVEGAPEKYKHIPNLCVVFQKCNFCPNLVNPEDIDMPCVYCGTRKHIFERDNTLDDFIDYLLNLDRKHKDVIVIAHNTRAYDGHFVLQAILEKRNDEPKIIVNGSQILAIFFTRYKFVDSLNFMNCGLAKLPAMFDLAGAMKGYYPFLFNTKANENAPPGTIPDMKYYMPEGMMPKERKSFETWYGTQKDVVFDNFAELKKYCENDVFILMQACEEFRKLFFDTTGFEIFRDSVTMASACMSVYRMRFMEKDTIPIVPKHGYRLRNNHSKSALKWLYWLEMKKGVQNLKHAGNGLEIKLPEGFFVDGFVRNGGENGRDKVYEFLGDYFHQCPKHFGQRRPSPAEIGGNDFEPQNHLAFRYDDTMARLNILKQKYDVEIIWECDFRKLEKTQEFKEFAQENQNLWNVPKLDPRDAMQGGRVNNLKIYEKIAKNAGEKIVYKDITSLYPFISREGVFPVGHPTQIYHGSNIKDFDINTMHGLVKLKIQPPEDLYIPVLPQKLHNKLLFHLCQKCADDESQNFCEHEPNQRSIIGTYVIEEVRLALRKGYIIEEIYEAWVYETVQRGVDNKTGLFTDYVNMFLKIKQQASGFPGWVTHDENGLEYTNEVRVQKEQEYIDKYAETEGIRLDRTKILENPGLRAIAKNCLNGLWGKFGERENKRRTVIVRDQATLWAYLTDPKYVIKSVIPINDEKTLVHYKFEEEEAPGLDHANVVIAAFTTAQARIELYKYLEMLGDRVNYFDTDAVIYTVKQGEEDPIEVSDFLGGMTDELSGYGKGSFATEFVSGGPKNYALKIFTPAKNEYTYMCKVKGITLNSENVRHINFEAIKAMVTDIASPRTIQVENKHKISRALTKGIWSSAQTKTYKAVLTKRWRESDNDYDTYPYGMKRRRVD